MSKRYILRKWYPSLPKERDLSPQHINTAYQKGENGDYYMHTKTGFHSIPKKEVENNPEFWEKVEKDYEILSFHKKGHPHLAMKGTKDRFDIRYEMYRPTEEELIEKGWQIHAVKKLSDGEVFTVGDRIYFDNVSPFKINEIEQHGKRIVFYSNGVPRVPNCYIENAIKVKQPLFTTEDGVDIFEGDSYCFIEPYAFYPQASIAPDKNDWKHDTVRFSTREKAQEWVEENKPLYSKNDILNALEDSAILKYSHHELTFKSLLNL